MGKAIATVPEDHGHHEKRRFNDGKASPGGVFLVGRMHLDFDDGQPGRFYRCLGDSLFSNPILPSSLAESVASTVRLDHSACSAMATF